MWWLRSVMWHSVCVLWVYVCTEFSCWLRRVRIEFCKTVFKLSMEAEPSNVNELKKSTQLIFDILECSTRNDKEGKRELRDCRWGNCDWRNANVRFEAIDSKRIRRVFSASLVFFSILLLLLLLWFRCCFLMLYGCTRCEGRAHTVPHIITKWLVMDNMLLQNAVYFWLE